MTLAAPYRFLEVDAVRAGPWMTDGADGPRPLPSLLPDWDYQTDLVLEREIQVDLDAVREQTGLTELADLRFGALWTARPSELRGPAALVTLPQAAETVMLEVRLPGSLLGGTLELETVVVLAAGREPSDGPIAHRAGSVLWSDRRRW